MRVVICWLLVLSNFYCAGAELVPGETVSASVTAGNRTNLHTFSGTAGEVVALRAVITSAVPNDTAIFMRLKGPDQESIVENNPNIVRDGHISFFDPVSLTMGGVHEVEIWSSNEGVTFDYSLTFINGGIPIAAGETVTGHIDQPSAIDAYTFTAGADELIAVRAVLTTNRSAAQGGIVLHVIAADGTVVAWDTLGVMRPLTSVFVSAAVPSGDYRIEVWDGRFGTAVFDYSLTLVKGDEAIVPGQTIASAITAPSQMRSYSFVGYSNDVIKALAVMTNSRSSSAGTLVMDILGPDGFSAFSDLQQVMRPAGEAFIDGVRLLMDGRYQILVYEKDGMAAFDYVLSFIKNPGPNIPSPDGGPISSGEVLPGTVEVGDLDVIEFDAGPCQIIELTFTNFTAGTAPFIEVQSPEGTVLATRTGDSHRLQFGSLLLTGTYHVVLRNQQPTASYEYEVGMRVISPGVPQMLPSGPSVVISSCSNQVVVSWLTNAADYRLQATTDLTLPDAWEELTGPFDAAGKQFFFSEPPESPARFYRLVRP